MVLVKKEIGSFPVLTDQSDIGANLDRSIDISTSSSVPERMSDADIFRIM